MQRDISQQNTTLLPLPASNEFHRYLTQYQLTWVEVARASGVPALTVWSIDHGLLVDSAQAALVRAGLQKLTGISFHGAIPTIRSKGEAMSGEEELLDYNEQLGWHTRSGPLFLRMTDATFQKHVRAYLGQQGITEPTQEQLIQARGYCRRVSFWEGCTAPDVYRLVSGQRK